MLLVLSLILMTGLAFAQTGMFGIEFDSPKADTDKALKAQGFQVKETQEYSTEYTHPKRPDLIGLKVEWSVDNETVMSWIINFDISKKDTTGEAVLAEVEKLHGDDDVTDDFDCDHIWYFDNDKALYMDIYESTKVVLRYTWGTYDDDEYWYYGDDYWDW
jgi:hypothetical protein